MPVLGAIDSLLCNGAALGLTSALMRRAYCLVDFTSQPSLASDDLSTWLLPTSHGFDCLWLLRIWGAPEGPGAEAHTDLAMHVGASTGLHNAEL